jgi:hypothetical protein
MRTLTLLLLVGISALGGFAAEPAKAELKFTAAFEKGELVLEITNPLEAEVAVVTAPADMTYDDTKNILTFGLFRTKDKEGKVVVPSESELKIVKLRRGETARVVVGPDTKRATWNALALTAYAAGEEALSKGTKDFEFKFKLDITYEVTDDWGKRFGVWIGRKSLAVEIGGRELPKISKE